MERPNVKLKLDLTTFSETPFVSVLERCTREGIRFETLHSLGDRYAISRGADTVFTVHDAENEAAIQMNRRLGFDDTDWERLV